MLHCIESLTGTSVYSNLQQPAYYLEIKAPVPVQHWYLSFIHSVTSQRPVGFILSINCCQLIFLFVTGFHRNPRLHSWVSEFLDISAVLNFSALLVVEFNFICNLILLCSKLYDNLTDVLCSRMWEHMVSSSALLFCLWNVSDWYWG